MSLLIHNTSLWIYIPCMQKRKSKKYNKCVNCTELSFGDSKTSALGGGRGEGVGLLECCDMQNAASPQNFCSILASGKFPAPWLTQKVKLFKALSKLRLPASRSFDSDKHWIEEWGNYRNLWSNLLPTDVKPPQCEQHIKGRKWSSSCNEEPTRTRNQWKFLQLLFRTDPPSSPINKFIFIT